MSSWSLKAQITKRLEALELRIYGPISKIPWTVRITNDKVLRRIDQDKQLLKIIKMLKTAYRGHVLRNEKYALLIVIMQGTIDGKKGMGRKKKSWLTNIRE